MKTILSILVLFLGIFSAGCSTADDYSGATLVNDGLINKTWNFKHIAYKDSDNIKINPDSSKETWLKFGINEPDKSGESYESAQRFNYKFEGQGPANTFSAVYSYEYTSENEKVVILDNFQITTGEHSSTEIKRFEEELVSVISSATTFNSYEDKITGEVILEISTTELNSVLVFVEAPLN